MLRTYTTKERNLYITGLLGQNILYAIVSSGFAYYLQSVIFVPAMAISVIFTVARVWDAIKDPIMGSIVDGTRSKWGKCRPYLLFSPFFVGLTTILVFLNGIYRSSNSSSVNALIIAWAAVSYLLWGMAYTAGDVPLWGIISMMTEDEKDRNKLLALARLIGSLGGGVIMVAIVPVSQFIGTYISEMIGDNTKGLQYGVAGLAIAITIVSTAMFQLAGIFTKERVVSQSGEKKSIRESFAIMWNCKPFRQILFSGVLRSPVMLLTIVQTTLFSYYYGDNGNTPYMHYLLILGGSNFAGQFAAMAIAARLTEKIAKEKLYQVCNVIAAVPYALIFVVYMIAPSSLHEPFWLICMFALFFAAGAGMGMVNVLQPVMIADAIDYEEYHTGYRPDAVFFSGQSFIVKLSSGIASIISGIAYSIIGFSGEGVKAVNDALYAGAVFKIDPMFATYRTAMFFLCSIPPAIGLLISGIPMRKYAMPAQEHKKILAELQQKRNELDL